MEGDLQTLQEIKGIGDKISEKIIKSVGGEEELQKIIDDVDVELAINEMNKLVVNETSKKRAGHNPWNDCWQSSAY